MLRSETFRRLIRRGPDLPVFIEAVVWLWIAWLALAILPFRHIASALRPRVQRYRSGRGDAESARVAWAVAAAATRVPWRAVCLQQGIAAQRMLAWRGIVTELHYGVAKGAEGARPAHVWVVVAGKIILGGENVTAYTRLAIFAAQPRNG